MGNCEALIFESKCAGKELGAHLHEVIDIVDFGIIILGNDSCIGGVVIIPSDSIHDCRILDFVNVGLVFLFSHFLRSRHKDSLHLLFNSLSKVGVPVAKCIDVGGCFYIVTTHE